MALDLNFPYTGSTTWATLYAGLRENFSQLNAKFTIEGWTTPSLDSGNWSQQETVKYRKDSFGLVYLVGRVAATATASPTLFTLNSGYRPAASRLYRKANLSDEWPYSVNTLTITSGGNVNVNFYTNGCAVSLNGITFWAGY